MNESILTSIKKMLGITESYTQFDMDLIIHINSVISILTQLGVGPETGFIISDKNKTWADWFTQSNDLESVKTYILLRVRLIFDPPANSTVVKAYEEIIRELTFRLQVTADPPLEIVEEEEEEVW